MAHLSDQERQEMEKAIREMLDRLQPSTYYVQTVSRPVGTEEELEQAWREGRAERQQVITKEQIVQAVVEFIMAWSGERTTGEAEKESA